MKALSCHHFGAGAYNIVRRRSAMKNFHSLKISQMKKFTVSAFKRNRFQKMFHVEQKRGNENENIISYI